MLLPPFDQAQQLFRGNLHGHSTHSDGSLSPAAVIEHYASAGYDFTCLSDHLWSKSHFTAETVLDTRDLNRDDFITITSAELHCKGKLYDQDGLWHILANGLPADFAYAPPEETAPELIQRAIDSGAYVTLAHPEWHSMTSEEAMTVSQAHGVEIYNHSCAVTSGRGSGVMIADLLLNHGRRISLTATDDSHFASNDWGGGWVYVAADNLTSSDIIQALKAKRHYSSSGVCFNYIALEDDTLIVDCDPAAGIVVSGQGHRALHREGNNISYAEFDLSNFDSDYFRITLRGHGGGMAWSNPYFRDEL